MQGSCHAERQTRVALEWDERTSAMDFGFTHKTKAREQYQETQRTSKTNVLVNDKTTNKKASPPSRGNSGKPT